MATEIVAQAERMQRLTEDLLELARLDNRLETGGRLHFTPTDLVSVAREAADAVAPLARQEGLTSSLEFLAQA